MTLLGIVNSTVAEELAMKDYVVKLFHVMVFRLLRAIPLAQPM